MDIKLTRRLGYIQVVLKEFIDRRQRLLIKRIRHRLREYFLHKHLAQRDRQLIDQAANAQRVVGNDRFFHVKDLSDIERHLRLFVRARYLTDLSDDRAVSDAHTRHCLGVEHVAQHFRGLLHLFIIVALAQLLH